MYPFATSVIETDRLLLCHLCADDTAFMLRLVNSHSWLRFIGDRNVKTLDDAHQYIINGPVSSYKRFGFGLYVVKLRNSHEPIGICGLVKRNTLNDPDIGFALLPEYAGFGYAYESASAVLNYARVCLGFSRVVAITTEENTQSISLLKKLGLQAENTVRFPDDKEFILFANTELPTLSQSKN